MLRARWIFGLVVAVAACDSGRQIPTRPAGSGNEGTCNPGDVQACVCIGGVRASGTQQCEADGTFGACVCRADATPADVAGGDGRADVDLDAGTGGGPDLGERRDGAGRGDVDFDAGIGDGPDLGARRDAAGGEDVSFDAGIGDGPDVFLGGRDAFVEGMDAVVAMDAFVGGMDAVVAMDAFVALDAQPAEVGAMDAFAADAFAADASAPDAFAPDAQPDAGFVDAGTMPCISDLQCPGGRCHNVLLQCVPLPPRPQCAPCTQSSECGIPPDRCSAISFGGATVETVCTQSCRLDVQCPRGYACNNGVCYPRSGSFRPHTCASVADMLAATTCSSTGMVDMCGVRNFDDGTCLVGFETCVIGCTSDADCPAPSLCRDYIVAKFCRP